MEIVCRYIQNEKVSKLTFMRNHLFHEQKRNNSSASPTDMMLIYRTCGTIKRNQSRMVNIKVSEFNDLFIIDYEITKLHLQNSKPIVNAHPGIIPLTRGLDSFKWANS